MPEFASGDITEISSEDRECPIIKCGMNTGITKGTLNIRGACVRLSDFNLTNLDQSSGHSYKAMRQYEILPESDGMFALNGDSGSIVFMLKRKKLVCVGMLIGCTSYKAGIVTPITPILQALRLPPRLHRFDDDPMEI